MDVKQGSFRSLYGIRWPVLGSVRSNVQTHRGGSGRGHPPFQGHSVSPRRAPKEFQRVRYRTIARHERSEERLLVFAIADIAKSQQGAEQ
jgi:hypothetical protein